MSNTAKWNWVTVELSVLLRHQVMKKEITEFGLEGRWEEGFLIPFTGWVQGGGLSYISFQHGTIVWLSRRWEDYMETQRLCHCWSWPTSQQKGEEVQQLCSCELQLVSATGCLLSHRTVTTATMNIKCKLRQERHGEFVTTGDLHNWMCQRENMAEVHSFALCVRKEQKPECNNLYHQHTVIILLILIRYGKQSRFFQLKQTQCIILVLV